jgi:hypothetical protein
MKHDDGEAQGRSDREKAVRALLAYVLLPAWTIPGILDWYWHRETKIERNAGAHESVMHLLMEIEAGAGVMMALFCEIEAGVIAAMLAAALLHEATVVWDVGYALPRRPIKQREQHTHSFLEAFPFTTTALAALINPRQARALLGIGPEKPRLRLRPRRPPLSITATLAIVVMSGLAGFLPHVEELVRCLRAKPTLAPQPPPPQPPPQEADLPLAI